MRTLLIVAVFLSVIKADDIESRIDNLVGEIVSNCTTCSQKTTLAVLPFEGNYGLSEQSATAVAEYVIAAMQ